MASANSHAQMVKVSDVFHHPEFNVARLSGDSVTDSKRKELTGALIREGWRMNGDGVLEVVKISKEWLEKAVSELTKTWEELKAKAEKDGNELPRLHCFEANRVNKNKIIAPKFMGVSGNCRNAVLLDANIARYTAKPESLPLITEYPVIVREFENERERAIAQMLENMGKLEGFSKPSEKDQLKCAQFILAQGGTQSDLRRAFTDTTGQKLYGILTLDKRFPEVKLVERIQRDPADPAFIRYGGIKGSDLPRLVMRSDEKALAEHNRKQETAGNEQVKPLDRAGLENFLSVPKTNDPKIMKKDNILEMQTQNPNRLVQAVAAAIINNNVDPLNKFMVHSTVYNTVESLCDLGVGPDLDAILVGLTKAQDLGVAIKTVKAALKV
jgi:hypothetical protein